MSAGIVVRGIDHIVLKTADQEASIAFYADELGLEPHRVEEWRRGEVGFPSVRVSETFIIDLAKGPPDGTNLAHFCFVVDKTDLEALKQNKRLRVEGESTSRWGALGRGISLYVLDPDDNRIELKYYE